LLIHVNRANRKVTVTLDTYLSILAVVSSFCAIGITFYQAYLQRTQQYASVMPILDSYNTSQLLDGTSGYAILITNNGLGPAFVEEASFKYNGKKYYSPNELANAIFKQANMTDNTLMYSDLWKGRVIPQGEKFALIESHDKKIEQLIRKNLDKIGIIIIYKSVYGEKWKHMFPSGSRDEHNVKID